MIRGVYFWKSLKKIIGDTGLKDIINTFKFPLEITQFKEILVNAF